MIDIYNVTKHKCFVKKKHVNKEEEDIIEGNQSIEMIENVTVK